MGESILVIVLIILIVALLGAVLFLALRSRQTGPQGASIELMNQNLNNLQSQLEQKIERISEHVRQGAEKSHERLHQQHAQTTEIIQKVTERLTMLDETNKQVVSFADQLQSLENILKNPKKRGILGEYYLESLLKSVFSPSQYKMQYGFKNGDIVDAAIFIQDKVIPIDSKFTLENYERLSKETDPVKRQTLEKQLKLDLKLRIDETSKYIRPEENTMEFAFMFIPAEGIYYDLLVNRIGTLEVNTQDLIEYAFLKKKVIIVSPTSFFAYLQTVLQGLRALQIEESAREIRKHVEKLGRHMASYEEHMKKLGKHLGTTVNMYNTSYKEFAKIEKDVIKIADSGSVTIEPLELERPSAHDKA